MIQAELHQTFFLAERRDAIGAEHPPRAMEKGGAGGTGRAGIRHALKRPVCEEEGTQERR